MYGDSVNTVKEFTCNNDNGNAVVTIDEFCYSKCANDKFCIPLRRVVQFNLSSTVVSADTSEKSQLRHVLCIIMFWEGS